MKTHCYEISFHRLFFAFLLIAVGIVFVCANTGIIQPEWKSVLISWQMLVIVIGLAQLFTRRLISGIVLLFVGGFFIVPKLSLVSPECQFIDAEFVSTYWPVLLIVVGVVILLFGTTQEKWRQRFVSNSDDDRKKCNNHQVEDTTIDEEGKINYKFLFSGTKNVFLDPVFRGGSIEATFGGIELDLRHTSLPEGTTVLHINVTFGGAEIYIPPTWNVEIKNQSVLGGFDDHRWTNSSSIDFSRKLVIIARCTLGGGEIK